METTSVKLSRNARAFVSAVEDRKGQYIRVTWESTPVVAAAHKGRVRKRVTATTRTGVDYANLAVNEDRETGSLPWGEWALFPWVIVHKGREYVRLTGVTNVETEWTIDGVVATREEAMALHTPAGRKSKGEPVTAFTVALDNVRSVGGVVIDHVPA